MPEENGDLDGTEGVDVVIVDGVETTVVIEHTHPPGSGVSSGTLIGISETGAPSETSAPGPPPGSGTTEPTPAEPTPTPGGASSGGEAVDAGMPLGAEIKKHAACDSAHSTDPGSVGWQGPTHKGSDAQSLAQADADEHNRKNPGHQASVLDGEGDDTHH